MKLLTEIEYNFDDVLMLPADEVTELRSRKDVDLDFRHLLKWGGKLSGVPIVAANMDGVGTMSMARAFHRAGHGATVALRKHYSLPELTEFFKTKDSRSAWYTIGINEETDTDKFNRFVDAGGAQHLDKICMDVPHGGLQAFHDRVREVRKLLPKVAIMAGNVTTPKLTRDLIEAGADIVKIGIGPGAGCETRNVTGIGRPQFSAVVDCARAAAEVGGIVCADGGCKKSGDLAKAFGAGAGLVMIGSMLAGHDEAESELLTDAEGKHMLFYGMSSSLAMQKHAGGMEDYKESEGNVRRVAYTGPVERKMRGILGGLRSAGTYLNAPTLAQFHQQAVFVPVLAQK